MCIYVQDFPPKASLNQHLNHTETCTRVEIFTFQVTDILSYVFLSLNVYVCARLNSKDRV